MGYQACSRYQAWNIIVSFIQLWDIKHVSDIKQGYHEKQIIISIHDRDLEKVLSGILPDLQDYDQHSVENGKNQLENHLYELSNGKEVFDLGIKVTSEVQRSWSAPKRFEVNSRNEIVIFNFISYHRTNRDIQFFIAQFKLIIVWSFEHSFEMKKSYAMLLQLQKLCYNVVTNYNFIDFHLMFGPFAKRRSAFTNNYKQSDVVL